MSKKFIKREIADAVDFLLDDIGTSDQKDIQNIEINLLENYHDHPFSLYTGKRLNDRRSLRIKAVFLKKIGKIFQTVAKLPSPSDSQDL